MHLAGLSLNPLQKLGEFHIFNIVVQGLYPIFKKSNMKGNHTYIEW